MDCAKVLLEAGADPSLGDFCRCACSRAGCTTAHILLKEYYGFRDWTGTYPLAQYMWSFDWLHLLEVVKGFESAKQCVLDMLRSAKFEETDLTCTCCRKCNRKESWQTFGKVDNTEMTNDVAKVMDEAELIEELELQMKEIEYDLDRGSDLEMVWMDGLPQLLVPREQINPGLKSDLETQHSTANAPWMEYFQQCLKCSEQLIQDRPRVSFIKHLRI
jgi:ssDNA-binding Zn-finger/Zn-ribbon topoisomerase 1